MRLVEFMFSTFWHFAGCLLILLLLLRFAFLMWNRFWRHWNIRKHGWPPQHCDADGDFNEQAAGLEGRYQLNEGTGLWEIMTFSDS